MEQDELFDKSFNELCLLCDFRLASLSRARSSGAIRALASWHFLGRRYSSSGTWRGCCSRRRGRRLLVLGKHGSNKEKQRVPLCPRPLVKLLRTMLKENNKGKGEDREQGQLENRGDQTPHDRKAGLIVKARRKDEREGIV
jgi:hypothetical protein